MENVNETLSVVNPNRIRGLVEEAENELLKIQPEIEYLKQCVNRLNELENKKFKISSLILSLKNLTENMDLTSFERNNAKGELKKDALDNVSSRTSSDSFLDVKTQRREIFLPDRAVSEVKNYLRCKNNLNYEIFKAVVFNSGVATTLDIKTFLVENGVKQPKSGKSFENIELKEISSRANYLVRKHILISVEPGVFKSSFGWNTVE